MPMLDDTGLGDFFATFLTPPASAGRGAPVVVPIRGAGGAIGNRGPGVSFADRWAGLGGAAPLAPGAVAPALPPPVDVAGAPVAGTGGPAVASPFDLGVGQTSTIDDAQIPANAAPTAGTSADAPAVPPTSLLGRVGGTISDWLGDHRSTLMALGAGMAGAQNLGQGLQRAGQMMPSAQQQDIAQGRMNATVRALVNRGLPQDAAVAAAANPALLAQILPQAFGVKQRQFTQIGEDMLGNKKFGFVDPVKGEVYNLDGSVFGAGGGGGGGAGNIPTGVDGQPLSGQPLMAHLEQTDPVLAAGVRGMIQGTANPNARNLQKLTPLAQLVDPSWNAQEFQARQKLLNSYKAGKDADEIKAINTVGGHLLTLGQAADDLKNTSFPWANWLKNKYLENTGDARVGRFQIAYNGVMDELAKAYRGGVVSDSEKRQWETAINNASSPEQMHGTIAQMADMLESKISASKQKYYGNMGPLAPQIVTVGEHAKQAFEQMPKVFEQMRAGQRAGAPSAPAAAPAASGAKNLQWTPDKGLQPIAPPAAPSAAAAPVKPGNYQWTPDHGLVPVQ